MRDFNVIIITLDGLRLDRLNLCSNLSSISKQNLFFSNMITVSPYTFTSIPAIFSGLYPSKNGVDAYYRMFKFKKDKCKTLTQYFKDAGYYTFADVINDCVLPKYGFDKIETHKIGDNLIPLHKKILSELSKKEKFFVYLHYTSIHDEYKKLTKKYTAFDDDYFNKKERNKKVYDSYVTKCDEYVKEVMDHARELALLKNTLIIFHSDHGTSNGDRKGEKLYGEFTYDYSIRTFCTMLLPDKISTRIDFQSRTIDIMPTILDIIDIKQDENFEKIQGESLMTFVEGKEKSDRIAFCETGGLRGPWPSPKEHNVFCVRYKNKKIIYNKTPDTWEFYDLEKDSKERNDLINENHEDIKEYKHLLLEKLKEAGINNIPTNLANEKI